MKPRSIFTALAVVGLSGISAPAQNSVIPPGDKEPFLRLEAGGPTTFVTALAFSPDGRTLYAAGYDKVVRVWNLDGKSGKFVLDKAAYRVPIGPGLDGSINAIALSPDGQWLAVGGMGIIRGGAGFRRPGLVVSSAIGMTRERWRDQGMIYVFNTTTRAVRALRGHQGPVLALTFAPAARGKPSLLVSAAGERDLEKKTFAGGVRLWDVTRAKNEEAYLDGRTGLALPGLDTRPALAVWHTGAKVKQLSVAIAWGDGNLRLWEVDKDEAPGKLEDGKYNSMAVYVPTLRQLITGSFREGSGRLQAWDVTSDKDVRPDADRRVSFRPDDKVYFFPRALTLFSSGATGELDHAAAVLRVPARKEEYRLALIDLNPRKFGPVVAERVLWRGGRNLPVLAAAPGGRFLAVAGNSEHEIDVYPIDELLQGRGEPQKLNSVGAVMRQLAFVTENHGGIGLWLSEDARNVVGPATPKVAADALVFDFARRSLVAADQGWKLSAPAAGGWDAKLVAIAKDARGNAVRLGAAVRQGGQEKQRIEFPVAFGVTDLALLPPLKPLNTPLLAVAFLDEKVQPWLYLYNAATGDKIRHFTGHTDRIRSLAFSGDGRLLASAADDQTVSVWSLTNLTKFLGQRGMLQGVDVKGVQGGLEVVHVDADSPAHAKLKAGDVIEGLVLDGKLRVIAAPFELYDTVSLIKPGQNVTLRVGGKDVDVKLGHAVDEWKPLITLFITRGATPGAREWVGWNSNGHYDASDRKTERLIGWHFNTGKEDSPTAFALADQYRKAFYREGILKHLVLQGSLSLALREWEKEDRRKPLPRPRMNVWSDPAGPDPKQIDGRGETLVRRPQDRLRVRIDDFPPEKVDSVTWQIGAKPRQALEPSVSQERSVDLSRLPWKPGDRYPIRVVLRTVEAEPQQFSKELLLRYQPPPPAVTLKAPARHLFVNKPAFTVEAEVEPGTVNLPFTIQLTQKQDGKDLLGLAQQAQGLKIDKELLLRPGDNWIELVAVNKDALRGYEEWETTRTGLVVTYTPPVQKAAPQITLEKIVPAAGETTTPQDITPGSPVVVRVPKVIIEGSIRAAEKIVKAEWGAAEKVGHPVSGFTGGKENALTIRQEVPLEPGLQTVRFVAKAGNSAEAESQVTIDYHPVLPHVQLIEPVQGAVFYDNGKDPPHVQLKGRLVPPDDRRPFNVVVLVNDQEVAADIDDEHYLTARLPLQPLDNRIQVRLSNRWKEVAIGGEVQVRYLRPPYDIQFDKPPASTMALTALTARVRSVLPLDRSGVVEATVNGRDIDGAKIEVSKDRDAWKVQLKDVPLDPGENNVRLQVRNAEADCREAGTVAVMYNPPPKPKLPPEVEILDPARDTKVTEPDMTVRFRVRSESPLRRLELIRQGRTPFRKGFDLAKEKPDAKGYYVLEGKVPLAPKDNSIYVEAVNDGGERQAAVVVNYLHLPVRLTIDTLTPRGAAGQPIAPQILSEGKLYFPEMANSRITLQGRVTWDQENDAQLKKINLVRVFVNGFQQLPAELRRPSGRSRERLFTAELLLNQPTGNYIDIALPDIPQDAGNRSEFRVACARPQKGQRLHVLLVGLGAKEEKKLTDEALYALQARQKAAGVYASQAFEQVRLYGPLYDYVTPDQIFTQLCLIKRTIDLLSTEGSANDVVMVYYQGDESVDRQGHFFLTSVSQYDKDLRRSGFTCPGLANFFGETLGAQLLLLDVGRVAAGQGLAPGEATDGVVKWPVDSYASVTRYLKLHRQAGTPLLADLKELMPRAGKWGDVVRLVKDKAAHLDPTSLLVYQRLREPLAELMIQRNP